MGEIWGAVTTRWDAVDPCDPINWLVIAGVLYVVTACRHTLAEKHLTLPHPQRISKIFLDVGGVFGAFVVAYIIFKKRPIADAQSAVFYILASIGSVGAEKLAPYLAMIGIRTSDSPDVPAGK